ncbi:MULTISPECIES: hypothetical protein [unclassified Paenibacillus]|uniref:hypothetical protein n=1 Tax=unclassified Paenibacillus TaxID=185978 RepID=UPI001AE37149|nr:MULTISPECIES: hypothetical protein [unclassified Paenibacillus]MBP1156187.1 hypothetical protein [Paenibacillus sp. PvP091]MBP1168427.1 hypothetical protein [Paenibacillus sp. PvR098]MBP2439455.1 hypothetical protein [Paenibacillus sp. PvP052]
MPNEKIDKETDGNPETMYEDTRVHERIGFRADDTVPIRNYGQPNEKLDGIDI